MASDVEEMLRMMAWERAKGELKSMISTYSSVDMEEMESIEQVIDDFIKRIEGWHM